MEILKKSSLTLFVLFLFSQFAYAQDFNNTSYAVTHDGLQVFQKISFPAVDDVDEYVIEIERIDEYGQTMLIEKIVTQENSVTVSLRAGHYRYRVLAYNRMTLLDGMSEWQEFNIFPIVKPVIEGYQPFYGMFFEMLDPNGALIIYGSDFFSYSEFALIRKSTDRDWLGVSLEGRSDVIFPASVTVEGNSASLVFPGGSLKQGTYEIFIRNPGGLWTVFGEVRVGFRRNSDFVFSFGYSPMIALFDIENAWEHDYNWEANEEIIIQQLDVFNPLGYYFRLGWLPFKTKSVSFGFGLEFNFLMDNYDKHRNKINGEPVFILFFNLLKGASLDLFWQFRQTVRLQHNVRAGIGYSMAYHNFMYTFVDGTNTHTYYHVPFTLDFNAGYSVQYFLFKNLYLEAGARLQYTHSFEPEYPLNHFSVFPFIGLGWQYGRWSEHIEVAEAASRGEDYSVPVTHHPKAEHVLSFGWSPMIPLSGYDLYGFRSDIGSAEQIRFLNGFNPVGFKLSYVNFPYRWSENKLGVGIDFYILDHVHRTKIEQEFVNIDLLSHLFFNVYYQRILSDNWQAGFHAGFGISNPYNYIDNFSGISLAVDTGVSFQYFFWKDMFIKAGIDVIFIFFDDYIRTSVRPELSIGWQINRNNETGLRLPGSKSPPKHPAAEDVIEEEPEVTAQEPVYEYQPPADQEEPPPRRIRRLLGQSSRFNSIGYSIGTSFINPLLIGTINLTIAPMNSIFLDFGFEIGAFSIYSDVESYNSIYPFFNAGIFHPFEEKGGFFFSMGIGYLLGNCTFEYGSVSLNLFAYNFTAGVNIGNVINVSYTLKTDFNSVGSKFSIGYVFRVE